MENLTDHAEVFRQEVSISDPPAGCMEPPQPLTYVKAQTQKGAVKYEYRDAEIQFDETEHGRVWRRDITIPARESVNFWTTTHQILPAEFEEPFIFAQPTIGVTVRVDAVSDIEHVVIFDHRLGGSVEALPHNTWRLEAACFANTLFRTVWKRADRAQMNTVDIGPRLRITPNAGETVPHVYGAKYGEYERRARERRARSDTPESSAG
jgi:hypothetical protein